MTRAAHSSFPFSAQVLCTLHMKKNVTKHLRDKFGLSSRERIYLVSSLFGPDGLIDEENMVNFEVRGDFLKLKWPVTDISYLNKICRQILDSLQLKWQGKIPGNWSNNNAESKNHVLKQMVNWRPEQLPKLVDILKDNAISMQLEVERALISRGEFQLCHEHQYLKTVIKELDNKINDHERHTVI
jgi:hypothetical protein